MPLKTKKLSRRELVKKFNALWTNRLADLHRHAFRMAQGYFPQFELDELLNETYLKLRRRLQKTGGKPLDLEDLLGYILVTMRSVLHDLLRRAWRERKLYQRFEQHLRNHQNTQPSATRSTTETLWRDELRLALKMAWANTDLKVKETRALRIWLTAESSRSLALQVLGLQNLSENEKQRAYDQPLHRAKRKLRIGFRPLREWIAQIGEYAVSTELADFLCDQLIDASPNDRR